MSRRIVKNLLAATAMTIAIPCVAAAQNVQAEIVALPEWNYDELYANGLSVEDIMDADVHGPTGDEIGSVENVIFGEDGKVLSIIAEIGGFAEIGDTHINVPFDEVEISADADGVEIPLTQETVEEYSLFADPLITATDAATDIEEVEGDNLGVALTGPRAWRATELIGDYARLKDGDGFANYGYVNDIIIRDGQIASVVVNSDVGYGAPGFYAYPYYGYGYRWHPGLGYYDLPYERDEVAELEPFDYELFDD